MNRRRGFTLIEVLVVLVIVGLVATGIGISLAALEGREAARAVERLRLVLEASAERAAVRGQPIAVEFLADGYRFTAFDTDGNWRALVDPPLFAERVLPSDVHLRQLLIEGREASTQPRLVFASAAPDFRLALDTPDGPVWLIGRATGAVDKRRDGERDEP
ncbi:MAG: prepilin-type N-terminal cleavage/methylation domain-containing protein [Rhodocyclaceae bacterium]|nr:prepilin-type N-terminal cleavage/methylation domain-containing protein [Rhodocyclaceae bacterium]